MIHTRLFKFAIFLSIICCGWNDTVAQTPADSSFTIGKKVITLNNVVLTNKLDVPSFIARVQADTSFYKAFKNLRVLNFTAQNDIRMLDRNGGLDASLQSKTHQTVQNGCRTMQVLSQNATGNMFNADSSFNYYTASMYASLFFTKGKICGETNVVKGTDFDSKHASGMEKRKAQLKMLFFNPGQKISGLPFMSNKTAIYDDDMADRYNFAIDMGLYNGVYCYKFEQTVKPGKEDGVVIDEMTTWFNQETMDVVARNYSISYDAGVYDATVTMEVEMTQFGNLTVPKLIRYNGNWKVITKKRERGVFTATLSDFSF